MTSQDVNHEHVADVHNAIRPQLSARLTVGEVNDYSSFIVLEPEWNALVESTDNQIFYRHDYIRTWVSNFAPRAHLRILLARDEAGELVAALPLIEERGTVYGAPVRQLVATANLHSYRFDMLARDAEAAGRAFFNYLTAHARWDLIRILGVPQGGAAWHLYNAARAGDYPVGAWAWVQSPYITLPSTFAEFQAGLRPRFRANLRRRRKNLEARGEVTVERVSDWAQLDQKLSEGFTLESSGWKGKQGTAIAQRPQTVHFYTALAHEAAGRGCLALSFLRVNRAPVAFHFGLLYDRRYSLLKTAYDESYAAYSPGQLLVEEVVRDCIAKGLREFDFMGPDMVWKRDWTDVARDHHWLFIFRDTLYGRALHTGKFRLLPKLKERLARWRT